MPSIKRVISLDCEATGVDVVVHGAMPYFVTICDQDGLSSGRGPRHWRWPVDPLTRWVDADGDDLLVIQAEIDRADEIAFHNSKYDIHALDTVGVKVPWEKVKDTLTGSHLLASNHKHNLTDTATEYLGVSIEHLEVWVREVTKACRGAIRLNQWASYGVDTSKWRLAEEGLEDMPSVSGSGKRDEDRPWKADMFVMHAVADALLSNGVDLDVAGFPEDWLTVLPQYGDADSAITLALWLWMEREIKRRGQWAIYLASLENQQLAYDMECRGATVSRRQTDKLVREFMAVADECQAECMAVAEQFDFPLEMPDGASVNDSLKEFIWGSVRVECPRCGLRRTHKHWDAGRLDGQVVCTRCAKKKGREVLQRDGRGRPLKHLPKVLVNGPEQVECVVMENPCLSLPIQYSAKTGSPTLDKAAMEHYTTTLEDGPALHFVDRLMTGRKRQTGASQARNYERFWVPTQYGDDWKRLHANFLPTGTDTLRWSMYNPNTANVNKQEEAGLRSCFGPAPGREWWSMDAENIELRIPGYESGEPSMVELFERPKDAPYFGSYHLLIASLLWSDEFWPLADKKGAFKVKYEATLYQWTKNFDFAEQYGCGRAKGDATAHRSGAWDIVREKLPRRTALSQKYLSMATRLGYVETIPDGSVDPDRGYPILASRTEDGRVQPTTPFCYHVSGTAMQWTCAAMRRCSRQLKQWNAEGWDGFMTLQVHDEIVFDCPRGTGERPWETNLQRMDVLRQLMAVGGDHIGVPTPVAREYHSESWATGISV